MKKDVTQLNISWESIGRFYLPILIALIVWYFRSLILVFVTAFIFASLLERPIDYLEEKGKNRWLATFIVYIITLFGLSILLYFAGGIITQNLALVVKILPQWLQPSSLQNWEQLWQHLNWGISQGFSDFTFSTEQLTNLFNSIFSQSAKIISKILGGTFYAFLVILISFFINTEKKGIEKALRLMVPHKYEEYVVYLWNKTRKRVGGWFFSQLLLSLGVGLLVYGSFSLLGIPNAGLLGVIAGIADFVPYLGPVVAGGLSFLVALSQGWTIALFALITFIIIQAIEALVAPSLRSKTMKLNPLVIILALLIGGKLAGVIGVIIILPLAATFVEFIKDLRSGRLQSYLPQLPII